MDNFGTYEKRQLIDYFKDPRKLMDAMTKHKSSLLTWIIFFIGVYAIYAFFSSGDFSFVLTLGSMVQMFGFILLAFKTYSSKSVSGISKNSIICYTICLFSRLVSILFYDGYLPYDASGDFVYRVTEVIAFICCVFVLYLMQVKHKQSYNWDLDNIKWYFIVGPTLFCGLLFHPTLNNSLIADIPWTFALYLEAFSMFPQIDLFRKKGGEIERFTSTYVASSGISKFLHFVFWIFTFSELNEETGTSLTPSLVGYYVIGVQFIQLVIIGEYLWYFLRSLNSGNPFQLPSSYYDV